MVSAAYDLLAWNHLATIFIGDEIPENNRNMIRWAFSRPRYPGDRSIESLVTELLAFSPAFARMWAEHEVETRRPMVKRVAHPRAGPLEFECQVLHISDTDQRLITYIAEPGSPTEAAFRSLQKLGILGLD